VPPHIDSGEPGRLNVAADGEGPSPERGAVEHHPPDRDDGGEKVDQQRHSEHVGGGDAVYLVDGDKLSPPVRQRLGQAAGGDKHRQCHDERDQPPVRNQDAVDQAGAHPDEQRAQDHHERPVTLGREGRSPHRCQRDQRTHRQVDAAADDDERHADRHHADDRGAHQDVQDV
jgi:hypothetical protein